LISGSGPQDRNEAAFGHQPFLILADHLTRKGITILRIDDRGVWQSTGEFSSATMVDFASDVHAGINYLKSRKDLNITQIGLIGHSEGGMIAPLVATETRDVKCLVMLNAPAKHLFDADVLAAQKYLAGKSAGDSEAKIKVQTNWEVSCPGLAIYADKDTQCPSAVNISSLKDAMARGNNSTFSVKELSGLNHMLQTSITGSESEYSEIAETISPLALEIITQWIHDQVANMKD